MSFLNSLFCSIITQSLLSGFTCSPAFDNCAGLCYNECTRKKYSIVVKHRTGRRILPTVLKRRSYFENRIISCRRPLRLRGRLTGSGCVNTHSGRTCKRKSYAGAKHTHRTGKRDRVRHLQYLQGRSYYLTCELRKRVCGHRRFFLQ